MLGIKLKNVLILDGMHTKNGITAAARHFSGLGQLLREFSIRSIQTAYREELGGKNNAEGGDITGE